jgi:hypothetical protein
MFLNLIVLPGLLSETYSRRKKEEGRTKKEEESPSTKLSG